MLKIKFKKLTFFSVRKRERQTDRYRLGEKQRQTHCETNWDTILFFFNKCSFGQRFLDTMYYLYWSEVKLTLNNFDNKRQNNKNRKSKVQPIWRRQNKHPIVLIMTAPYVFVTITIYNITRILHTWKSDKEKFWST